MSLTAQTTGGYTAASLIGVMRFFYARNLIVMVGNASKYNTRFAGNSWCSPVAALSDSRPPLVTNGVFLTDRRFLI